MAKVEDLVIIKGEGTRPFVFWGGVFFYFLGGWLKGGRGGSR